MNNHHRVAFHYHGILFPRKFAAAAIELLLNQRDLGLAYLHHLCAGIRHLMLDIDCGTGLETARLTSIKTEAPPPPDEALRVGGKY